LPELALSRDSRVPPFIKKRRIECFNALRLHRKIGVRGHSALSLMERTADPSASRSG
jgi:hypothetical protein